MIVKTNPHPYCDECLGWVDRDPSDWCDCWWGEYCAGPCRNRAHAPAACPAFVVNEQIPILREVAS